MREGGTRRDETRSGVKSWARAGWKHYRCRGKGKARTRAGAGAGAVFLAFSPFHTHTHTRHTHSERAGPTLGPQRLDSPSLEPSNHHTRGLRADMYAPPPALPPPTPPSQRQPRALIGRPGSCSPHRRLLISCHWTRSFPWAPATVLHARDTAALRT